MPDPAPERALIGATLNQPRPEALRAVLPEDFYLPAHETIWAAIRALDDAGAAIDTVTVVDHLTTRGTLASVGGLPYIAELITEGSNPAAATSYARIVVENAARRRLTTAGTRIAQIAKSGEGDPRTITELAMAEIEAATPNVATASVTRLGDFIGDVIDDLASDEPIAGIEWPYRDAARILLPLRPGNLVLVGARPAVGKSVTLVDIARHAAIHDGKTVVLFSMEMPKEAIAERIISAEARIHQSRVQAKALDDGDWDRVAAAAHLLAAAQLHVYDTPAVSISDVRGAIKAHKPDLVLIDYIQLGGTNPGITDRRQALEDYARKLKQLALSSGVAVVAAAQVARLKDNDQPPTMANLRETGGYEADADTVVLLHRPDAADPEHARAGEIDLIVAKQRAGAVGTIHLAHQMHYSRIVDMAHQ